MSAAVAISRTNANRGRPRSPAADTAIRDATFRLLTEHGFSGTTMTAIAKSAGVSSATLYRRYSCLNDVVIDALSHQVRDHRMPDLGDLSSDLRAWLKQLVSRLTHPRGARLIAALLDEAARNPDIAEALYNNVSAPLRRDVALMFERAIERGEMRADVDIELAIDLAVGPIYLRRLESVRPIDHDLYNRLADMVLAAIGTNQEHS